MNSQYPTPMVTRAQRGTSGSGETKPSMNPQMDSSSATTIHHLDASTCREAEGFAARARAGPNHASPMYAPAAPEMQMHDNSTKPCAATKSNSRPARSCCAVKANKAPSDSPFRPIR